MHAAEQEHGNVMINIILIVPESDCTHVRILLVRNVRSERYDQGMSPPLTLTRHTSAHGCGSTYSSVTRGQLAPNLHHPSQLKVFINIVSPTVFRDWLSPGNC